MEILEGINSKQMTESIIFTERKKKILSCSVHKADAVNAPKVRNYLK